MLGQKKTKFFVPHKLMKEIIRNSFKTSNKDVFFSRMNAIKSFLFTKKQHQLNQIKQANKFQTLKKEKPTKLFKKLQMTMIFIKQQSKMENNTRIKWPKKQNQIYISYKESQNIKQNFQEKRRKDNSRKKEIPSYWWKIKSKICNKF